MQIVHGILTVAENLWESHDYNNTSNLQAFVFFNLKSFFIQIKLNWYDIHLYLV